MRQLGMSRIQETIELSRVLSPPKKASRILGLLMIGGMIAMVTIRQQRTAIEILHARFASGNIDRAEYDHRRHLADEFERIRRWAVLARTRKVR